MELIPKRAAIEKLQRECREVSDYLDEMEGCDSYCLAVEGIAKCLNDMRVVKPEQSTGRWIPCSERLPEYGVGVLTFNRDDEYEVNHIIDEEDGEWFFDGVIAWMPLPEPYKPEP